MNYYDARKRQDNGLWDYTSMNDGRIHPVGYCASSTSCPNWSVITLRCEPDCELCHGAGLVDNPDWCGSHETAELAFACFDRYLLDEIREESYGDWTGCEFKGCDNPTKQGLATRPPLGNGYALCDEHRTGEILRDLAGWHGQHIQITASY